MRSGKVKVKALALLGLALPCVVHAACRIETLELPVKMVGSRAVATVHVNGTAVPLTVDSGAFFSFLTEAAAAQLKLPLSPAYGLRVQGITGRVETQKTTVETLHLLNGDIPNVDFLVGVNEPGAGTMGLLGRNLLSFTDTEYDLAHGMIRLSFPNEGCADANLAYWAGDTPVSELDLIAAPRSKVPSIRAKAKLNGKNVVALFDTGATTVVSILAAQRAGVAEADMVPNGQVYGAGKGRAKAFTAAFETFEIGGETIRHNRLHVASYEIEGSDMLIGIDFFLSHRIYVSQKQSKMFFTYNGGTVFALDRSEAPPAAAEAGAAPAASDAASASVAASADELARRGAASASRRNYAAALADLDRACELEPHSAALFAQRGVIHEALGQPAKARADFDQALELDPAQADARFRRLTLRIAAKDREGALADLGVLDQSLVPQAQMRLAMASVYNELGLPAGALAQLDHWLPAHPREVRREAALNSRCWARLRLGLELEKALVDCDEAVDADPKNGNYLDSRGWVHLHLGNDRKALADFDRSIEARPGSAWSWVGRSLTKARLGDAVQAEADLGTARKLRPTIEAEVERAGLMAGLGPKR